jgi:hypothetical protein
MAQLNNQRIHPYRPPDSWYGDGLATTDLTFLRAGRNGAHNPFGALAWWKNVGIAYYLWWRARTIEAILWHDGEGKNAKDQFMQLSAADRSKILTFLKSLWAALFCRPCIEKWLFMSESFSIFKNVKICGNPLIGTPSSSIRQFAFP